MLRIAARRWLGDPALRGCLPATRGLWVDLQCVMVSKDPYGFLTDGEKCPLSLATLRSRLCVDRDVLDEAIAEMLRHRLLRWYSLTKREPIDTPGAADACLAAPSLLHAAAVGRVRAAAGRKGAKRARRTVAAVTPTPSAKDPVEAMPPSLDLFGDDGDTRACPDMDLVDLYEQLLPELPAIRKSCWPESPTQRALMARWQEGLAGSGVPEWMAYRDRKSGLAAWHDFFESVASRPFLMGKETAWRANLRWLVNKTNFHKILDGECLSRRLRD